jgi:hypothetical protein
MGLGGLLWGKRVRTRVERMRMMGVVSFGFSFEKFLSNALDNVDTTIMRDTPSS